VDPVDLSRFGHQDGKIRWAISQGVDPIVAFQMATLNPAEYYRVDHDVGSLAPGRYADIVVLSDVETVDIDFIVAGGEPLTAEPPVQPPTSLLVRSSVRFGRSLEARDFKVRAATHPRQEVRVIEVSGSSLVSGAGTASLAVADENVDPDPARDILKAAAIDRYSGSARMGLAFISGFGFRDGAVATTYQHPFFNVLVVGTSDATIALAANRVAELGGGIAVIDGGKVARDWQLSEVGVFAEGPLAHVRQEFEAVNNAIRALGCQFHAPILALAFSALPTIPAYGLSPLGLYDVAAGRFVSPLLEGEPA
jgi:adenine deaminase